MSREAMKQALEALESDNPDIQLRAAIALRAALDTPEPEPFGYFKYDMRLDAWVKSQTNRGVAFYTREKNT